MGVEHVAALSVARLHGDPPAALDTLVEQRRQRIFQLRFGQMVEENLGHAASTPPAGQDS